MELKQSSEDDSAHSLMPRAQVLPRDYFYGATALIVVLAYAIHLYSPTAEYSFLKYPILQKFSAQIYKLINEIWWGIAASILGVGFLNQLPREMVVRYFVRGPRLLGLAKATIAGTVFDLCNQGVLLLGMKIYQRGASLGQTMAFLIASPWNSFSLTLILYILLGGNLTFLYTVLSLLVAIFSGWIFDELVRREFLPGRAVSQIEFVEAIAPPKIGLSLKYFVSLLQVGFRESAAILKWVFVGLILSSLIHALIQAETFRQYFGKSIIGMLSTLAAATGLEFFSQAFVPLAADLVRLAEAPGNAFIFLMAGTVTNWASLLSIKRTTGSWKVALFLPLITVPQILILGELINRGIL